MTDEQERRLADAKSADIALLVSVPHLHLVSGLDTIAAAGRVAYGTDNGMVLSQLQNALAGQTCVVLIYASGQSSGPPKATWRAIYGQQTGARSGKHPDPKIRPASTQSDGPFLTFWQGLDLTELDPNDAISLNTLRAFGSGKRFAATYVPRGPILIANPY